MEIKKVDFKKRPCALSLFYGYSHLDIKAIVQNGNMMQYRMDLDPSNSQGNPVVS